MTITNAVLRPVKSNDNAVWLHNDSAVYEIILNAFGENLDKEGIIISAENFAQIAVECFKTAGVEDWIVSGIRQLMHSNVDVKYDISEISESDPVIETLQVATDLIWGSSGVTDIPKARVLLGEVETIIAQRSTT